MKLVTIDDLLAAMPAPAGSERLDVLEAEVWRALDRRRRQLRNAGVATLGVTFFCVVCGSFYGAQIRERGSASQRILQQALSQDRPMILLE